jgi:hypothetical protein
MSFLVQAPYPLMQTTLLLRSPLQANTQKLAATIQTVRSMNGTLYTYVKAKRGRKLFSWDFLSSKDKALEAKSFVKQYAGDLVRITDHEGTIRLGYITINPLEARGEGRAGGWPSNEAYSFTLSIEELV